MPIVMILLGVVGFFLALKAGFIVAAITVVVIVFLLNTRYVRLLELGALFYYALGSSIILGLVVGSIVRAVVLIGKADKDTWTDLITWLFTV